MKAELFPQSCRSCQARIGNGELFGFVLGKDWATPPALDGERHPENRGGLLVPAWVTAETIVVGIDGDSATDDFRTWYIAQRPYGQPVADADPRYAHRSLLMSLIENQRQWHTAYGRSKVLWLYLQKCAACGDPDPLGAVDTLAAIPELRRKLAIAQDMAIMPTLAGEVAAGRDPCICHECGGRFGVEELVEYRTHFFSGLELDRPPPPDPWAGREDVMYHRDWAMPFWAERAGKASPEQKARFQTDPRRERAAWFEKLFSDRDFGPGSRYRGIGPLACPGCGTPDPIGLGAAARDALAAERDYLGADWPPPQPSPAPRGALRRE